MSTLHTRSIRRQIFPEIVHNSIEGETTGQKISLVGNTRNQE